MGGVGGVDAILDVAFFEKRLGDGDDHGVGCEVRHLFFFFRVFFFWEFPHSGVLVGVVCVLLFFFPGGQIFFCSVEILLLGDSSFFFS